MVFILSSKLRFIRRVAYATMIEAIWVMLIPDMSSECAFVLESSSLVWAAEKALKSPVNDVRTLVRPEAVVDDLIDHEQRCLKLYAQLIPRRAVKRRAVAVQQIPKSLIEFSELLSIRYIIGTTLVIRLGFKRDRGPEVVGAGAIACRLVGSQLRRNTWL